MRIDEELCEGRRLGGGSGKAPLIVKVADFEFQQEVLAKLGRLEAKMDMLVGNGQPGRMKQAEDRLRMLEEHDIKRSVYDRLVNAGIAFVVSVAIALHDHFGLR